jgi:hypothetical protein
MINRGWEFQALAKPPMPLPIPAQNVGLPALASQRLARIRLPSKLRPLYENLELDAVERQQWS